MESGSINWSEKESARAKRLLKRTLPVSFYERHTLDVAQDLLGKVILVSSPQGVSAGRIIETEAYRADDPASHSARGVTPRSAIMFGPPAVAYVYFIYGMYRMLNFVTEGVGHPGAVLIRAVEPLLGFDLIAQRRAGVRQKLWTQGPGRLTQALGIEMSDLGCSLLGPRLFVCEDDYVVSSMSESARVGIRVATEKPWRFFISGHPGVSDVPENQRARVLSRR